jgi:hypothetical protein
MGSGRGGCWWCWGWGDDDDDGDGDSDARSICTIVPHELESIEEEDEQQMARQEQQH